MSVIRPTPTHPMRDGDNGSDAVILRDGSTVVLRIAQPEDVDALQQFVTRLSPAARRHRFFSESAPPIEMLRALCNPSQPQRSLAVLACRRQDGALRVIASGSYHARRPHEAEVAMAVDDRLHGQGLGTLVLERLALLAVRHGFTKLWAVTHADNLAMRDVFTSSGLTTQEHLEGGDIEVELSLLPTDQSVRRSEWRERVATTASLRPFFHPRTVAVVGASRATHRLGYRLLDTLRGYGFQGRCYAVNPHATSIIGVPCYPSLRAVPEPVDLAVIVVPKDAVLSVVHDCAAAQVRAGVLITAGFAELGEEGVRLQDQIVSLVRQQGMRLVGPNCFGLLNTDPTVRLNATFTVTTPATGTVALASQSGAVGIMLLSASQRLGLGISSFVSVGNKADVSVNDLLQYWEQDPATQVILLYMESFGNPRRFAKIARRVGHDKPIVTLKAGRTVSGTRAAQSHTAALAANDVAVEALCRQTGMLRADTLEDLFALATCLSSQPLPAGHRVGILTNAGGPAILCADACEAGGLEVPELSPATVATLRSFLPPAAALRNPVDLVASATPAQYAQAITTLLASDDIDALIILYIAITATDIEEIAEGIRQGIGDAEPASRGGKPISIVWMAEQDRERTFVLPTETIPIFALPEPPARALSRILDYAQWRRRPVGFVPKLDRFDSAAARGVCREALTQRGPGWLTADESRAVLTAVSLPLPPSGTAAGAEEAAALAERIGFPVAVKLASRTLVHKTDIGGVHLHLADKEAVRRAYEAIHTRLQQDGRLHEMDGVVVQRMLSGGVEVMAGMTHDPSFGPLIAFGLGGIHVEILGDVQFRITPLTDVDAAELVRSIKGARLLQGYRGHPPADISAIEALLLRLSQLVDDVPEIAEIDLNPIFALPPGQGCVIVDARIRVTEDSAAARRRSHA